MTKYEELCKILTESRKRRYDYGQNCARILHILKDRMRATWGIPEEHITFVPSDDKTDKTGRYQAILAMHLEEDLYWHVGIRITLHDGKSNTRPHYVFFKIMIKKIDDVFKVKMAKAETIFNIRESSEDDYDVFWDHVFNNIKDHFEHMSGKLVKEEETINKIGF